MTKLSPVWQAARPRGFTLLELLAVIAILSILMGLLLPSLHQAKAKAQGIYCCTNLKQLALAWYTYAGDHDDRLVYNLGGDRNQPILPQNLEHNWVNNVMTWELEPGNTNLAFINQSPLGSYLGRVAGVFRCPADNVLSAPQRRAGWSGRVRSIALNAMVGNPGPNLQKGSNIVNPGYRQFLHLSDIKDPAHIFTFLDEHPDSVSDGYFLNKGDDLQWIHLPASYHNGAGSLTFADGHQESHAWTCAETKRPPKPDAGPLPFDVPTGQAADYNWLLSRTSVEW